MDVEREIYEQWRVGEFDDSAAEAITSLSTNALRDLQRAGALRASGGGGRGKRRSWNREALCKGAMTAELRKGGLSLPMAARIAFYVWNISPNSSFDPMLRFPTWEELNGKPVLDTSERAPGEHAVKKWLTDDFATPCHDDDFDSYVHIANGSFVIAEAAVVPSYRRIRADQSDPELSGKIDGFLREKLGGSFEELLTVVLGRISEDGSTFYTWHQPRRKRMFNDEQRTQWEAAKAEGVEIMDFMKTLGPDNSFMEDQYSDEISLDFLQYQLEPEANREKAANAFFNFTVKISVNVTLAMRTAMRRALNLPVIGE